MSKVKADGQTWPTKPISSSAIRNRFRLPPTKSSSSNRLIVTPIVENRTRCVKTFAERLRSAVNGSRQMRDAPRSASIFATKRCSGDVDHNLAKLSDAQQKRVRLLSQDVRKKNRPAVDVLAAQNFSFWIFKTRQEVIDYFKMARSNLNSNGIMVMDMMGGGDCYEEELVDKRTIVKGKRGFKYEWKQASFNPITADAKFANQLSF